MTIPSPACYRTTNWSSYNAAPKKRGSLLIWLDKEMTWPIPHDSRPGRPAVFSDVAIQVCFSIKALFKLPSRQTAGMVSSLLKLAALTDQRPFLSMALRPERADLQVPVLTSVAHQIFSAWPS